MLGNHVLGTALQATSRLDEFGGVVEYLNRAEEVLQALGCARVRLLTNNPAKLDGLSDAGIDVSARVPLHGAITADNRLPSDTWGTYRSTTASVTIIGR